MKKTIAYSSIILGVVLCGLVVIPAIFRRESSAENQTSTVNLHSTKDPRLKHAGVTEGAPKQSQKPLYAVVGDQEQLTPFPDDMRTQNIMRQGQLQREGGNLASHGLYEEAIAKFNQAMDPSILNEEHDKSLSLWYILRIHQRQGKYELALKELETNTYEANKKKDSYQDKHLELLSLLSFQRTSSPHPVHAHIRYLREKHKKYLPPNDGVGGLTGGIISTIIHLYDAIGDPEGGIVFVDGVLAHLKKYDRSYAGKKEFEEYSRVRQAFLLDQQTGKKGHLREALQDSFYISW